MSYVTYFSYFSFIIFKFSMYFKLIMNDFLNFLANILQFSRKFCIFAFKIYSL